QVSTRSRSLWATFFRPRLPGAARRAPGLITLALGAAALCLPVSAKVLMTQDEALLAAFGPDRPPARRTVFLTDDQAERIRALSGTPPASRIVVYYTGGPDPNAPLTAF